MQGKRRMVPRCMRGLVHRAPYGSAGCSSGSTRRAGRWEKQRACGAAALSCGGEARADRLRGGMEKRLPAASAGCSSGHTSGQGGGKSKGHVLQQRPAVAGRRGQRESKRGHGATIASCQQLPAIASCQRWLQQPPWHAYKLERRRLHLEAGTALVFSWPEADQLLLVLRLRGWGLTPWRS